jgi:hypothetical protein
MLAFGAQHREEILDAAHQHEVSDPEFVADALFLVLRGFYLMSVEDPETWTSSRVGPVVRHLVEVLSVAPGDRASGPASQPP